MAYGIRARWLWDGTGSDPIRDPIIVIDEDRIGTIGPSESITVSSDLEIIDRGNEFLMPGLIDAHTHITIIPGLGNQIGQLCQPVELQAIRGVGNLRRMLASGVTTARIMGEEHLLDVTFRDALASGTILGPKLNIATRPITQSNGHGRARSTADGVDEVRKASRLNLYHGADFLKLFITGGVSSTRGGGIQAASYSREEIRVAVEEAERNGTYVAAHAIGGPGIRLGVEEGVRTIEHATLASDDDLELIEDRDAWVVLTQAIMLHPTGIEQGDRDNPTIMAKLQDARERAAERLRAIAVSSVNLAVGTDSMHGLLPFEIEKLVDWGASPAKALQAATSDAAACCRLENTIGTLEVGKTADLIAVAGNPLENIRDINQTRLIVQSGRRIDATALRAGLI
jgi:imidazolonepropionase-like amidohydrolase